MHYIEALLKAFNQANKENEARRLEEVTEEAAQDVSTMPENESRFHY